MKAHDRTPVGTPILIGLSLLLIGIAHISALWTLTQVIFPTLIESPTTDNIQPAKFSP